MKSCKAYGQFSSYFEQVCELLISCSDDDRDNQNYRVLIGKKCFAQGSVLNKRLNRINCKSLNWLKIPYSHACNLVNT